jgi:lipid-binding SYLF domain-containing protein
MKNWIGPLVVLLAVGLAPVVHAEEETKSDWRAMKRQEKRDSIDEMAQDALDRLFEQSPGAKTLFDRAHGYAVFDNWKFGLIVTGGGGIGVATRIEDGQRTYMKMGTGGVGLGVGGQKYQVVFLFDSAEVFDSFVEKGWQADTSATAAAGDVGANAASTFRNGMAIYPMTESGLMAQADITGTKFWKYKKLNKK